MRLRLVVAVAVTIVFTGTVGFSQSQGRAEPNEYVVPFFGQFVAACDGFDVLYNEWVTFRAMTIYEKDGSIKQSVEHGTPFDLVFYNSADPSKSLEAPPGILGNARYIYEDGKWILLAVAGPITKVRVPGYGMIYMETGLIVWAMPSWDVVFKSGPSVGEAETIALCNALR